MPRRRLPRRYDIGEIFVKCSIHELHDRFHTCDLFQFWASCYRKESQKLSCKNAEFKSSFHSFYTRYFKPRKNYGKIGSARDSWVRKSCTWDTEFPHDMEFWFYFDTLSRGGSYRFSNLGSYWFSNQSSALIGLDLRDGALLLEISQVLQDFVQDLNHWRGQGLVVLRRAFHPLHQKFDSYYLENTNTEGFTSQSKESSPLCIAHYDTWPVTSSSMWVQGSHAQRILQPVFWENILQSVIGVITKCDRSSYYKVRR